MLCALQHSQAMEVLWSLPDACCSTQDWNQLCSVVIDMPHCLRHISRMHQVTPQNCSLSRLPDPTLRPNSYLTPSFLLCDWNTALLLGLLYDSSIQQPAFLPQTFSFSSVFKLPSRVLVSFRHFSVAKQSPCRVQHLTWQVWLGAAQHPVWQGV